MKIKLWPSVITAVDSKIWHHKTDFRANEDGEEQNIDLWVCKHRVLILWFVNKSTWRYIFPFNQFLSVRLLPKFIDIDFFNVIYVDHDYLATWAYQVVDFTSLSSKH